MTENDRFQAVIIAFTLVASIIATCSLPPACLSAVGRHGMVASVDEYASRIGINVLENGGNAVDAAVAVHMVLAVTHPQAGNLGGGGFMVIHMEDAGEEGDVDTAIDFREKAPLGAYRDMYLDNDGEVIPGASTLGYLACGVPGSVAGMWAIHQEYGTMPWEQLLVPAYRLAKQGFVIGPMLARDLRDAHEKLIEFPATAAIFTKDGEPFKQGDILFQEDLAWTIKEIMERGRDGFYNGEVAARIAADMRTNGGMITEKDLAEYQPSLREPIICEFKGHTVVSMPPPSSGGLLLCQMLGMLSDFDLKALRHNSVDYIHLLTEVEKLAYADRAEYLGDADFYHVAVDHLLSPDYIAVRATGIDLEHATPSSRITHGPRTLREIEGSMVEDPIDRAPDGIKEKPRGPADRDTEEDREPRESPQTTHFSIVDRYGNAISCTTTLNGRFGSCVVAAGTGVLLNNEMDDFSVKPGVPNIYGLVGGEANAIEPGKRMLSSMTPTIVLAGSATALEGAHAAADDSRVRLVLGSPGGSTIITTVMQVILNVLVHEMSLEKAVGAPRFHHQWLPDETVVESTGIPREALEGIMKMGHAVREVDALGDVHAILIERRPDHSTDEGHDLLIGVSDPRRGGTAVGY